MAGRISEKEMLRCTEYFSRWRYDYRLYRPILRFARAKGIPLLALNPPREWVDRVAEGGVAALDPQIRRRLPEMDASDPAYRARIRRVFTYHHRGRHRMGTMRSLTCYATRNTLTPMIRSFRCRHTQALFEGRCPHRFLAIRAVA